MLKCFLRLLSLTILTLLTANATADTPSRIDNEPNNSNDIRITFYGDSITAGFGLEQESAYPAVTESLLKKQGLAATVTNAGVSGDTTSNGLQRLDWTLKRTSKTPAVELFVLALGSNDGLRGLSPREMENNLERIILRVKEQRPESTVILVGAKAPPNMGESYAQEFAAVFPRLAERLKITLIPFILEGVAGNRELNQLDGIHPNSYGHKKIAETILPYLEQMLKPKHQK